MIRGWWLLALCGCDKLFSIDSFAPIDARPPIPSAVASYPMESVGSAAVHCMTDATDHGHFGNCISGMPLVVPGRVGMAYKFDGMVQIHVPDAPELDPPEFTVSFWAKLATSMGGCPVNRLHTGTVDDNAWQVCISSSSMFFRAGTGAVQSTVPVPVDEWHHFAVTFATDTVEGWLDGVSLGQMPALVAFDMRDMVLGTDIDNGTPAAMYDGSLDEVRFYDQALSQGAIEILAMGQ